MLDYDLKGKIVITCKDRFSSYVEEEVVSLGFKPVKIERTFVEIEGSLNDCIDLNLHLRTASHVLYELKSFYLHKADDIYRRVKVIPWEDYLEPDTYISVISTVDNDTVTNPLFVNVRIKDAIVDRFREKFDRRPDSGSNLDGAVLQLYWKETQATLYINTSGETLAKHGYRKIPGHAPMLEALASATILASGWDMMSPFVNPMCGSGTLAIEAALMATGRYPGLMRDQYSFMFFKGYDATVYQKIKAKMERKIFRAPNLKIIASDISEQAVLFARENAAVAGVEDLIEFQVCDFRDTYVPETGEGVVFFNPEYGERLGEEGDLGEVYQSMGDFLKQKCTGYTGLIFTGNMVLAKKVGLRTARRIEFYNGTIDCRLLKYELFKGKK